MFIPIVAQDAPQRSGDPATHPAYPADSAIAESDWQVLAAFWHPVAYTKDVPADRPVAARLLDVDLVLYRSGDGALTVSTDRCPHRGARLSMGSVRDDQLVCPMHGLHFDAGGHCVRIPSLGNAAVQIPPKLHLQIVPVQERYGIVWVSLKDEQTCPLPEWPGITDDPARRIHPGPGVWKTSAGRHVENFNDIAHFPWVHTQSFGGEQDASVKPYAVRETAHGLAFDVDYVEGFNRFPDGVAGTERQVRYEYELTFPFSTIITVCPKDSDYRLYVADAACPESATSTRVFQVTSDNAPTFDVAYWQHDADTINTEDAALVEGQSPKELPLDLRMEVSLPSDRFSRQYRTALAKRLGLGQR